MSKAISVTKQKAKYKEYTDFIKQIGYERLDGIAVTHDGFPLSTKEEKFISLMTVNGDVGKALKESGVNNLRNIAGKDYIIDEIKYRLDMLKKETIADADEIMQYFTKVMRNEEKDQFGLDAPLSERTAAAKELARRVIDIENVNNEVAPEIKVTLNFEGLE